MADKSPSAKQVKEATEDEAKEAATAKNEAATKEEASKPPPTKQVKEATEDEGKEDEAKKAAKKDRNSSASPTPWDRRVLREAGSHYMTRDCRRLHERAATITVANQQALLAEAKALARRTVRPQVLCFPDSNKTVVRALQDL